MALLERGFPLGNVAEATGYDRQWLAAHRPAPHPRGEHRSPTP